eukprot:gene3908-3951_t
MAAEANAKKNANRRGNAEREADARGVGSGYHIGRRKQEGDKVLPLGLAVVDEISLCPAVLFDHLLAMFIPRLLAEGVGDPQDPTWYARSPFALVPIVIVMGDWCQKSPNPQQGMSLSEWLKMFRLFPPHARCPAAMHNAVFGDLRTKRKCQVCARGGSLDECFRERLKAANDGPQDMQNLPPAQPTNHGPRGWQLPTRKTAGSYYIDALRLIEEFHIDSRSKLGHPSDYWPLWRAFEGYLRLSQDVVMLKHTMRFVDDSGAVDPTGPLPTLLKLMHRGLYIPKELFHWVVSGRAVSQCKIGPGAFPLDKTVHIAPGWAFVAPMNLRCAQHFAAETGKLLFLIPASVKQVGGDKKLPDRPLRLAIFQPNSNTSGGRMGLLPLSVGCEVELLAKLCGEVNLLKGAKGIVEEIIPDPREPVDWASPDSAANRRGWAILQFFPIVHVRFNKGHCVQGAVPGDSSLIAFEATCQTQRGRPDSWSYAWSSGSDTRGKPNREFARL